MNKKKQTNRLILFISTVFFWTWTPWLITVFSGLHFTDPGASFLIGLGGVGPLIGALAVLFITGNGERIRKDYFKRAIGFPFLRRESYLFILLFLPVVTLLATIFSTFIGEPFPPFPSEQVPHGIPAFIGFALFILFFGPVPEELGWRGVALDLLTAKWNKIQSTFLLAAMWGFWHLPLFFIDGTYQRTEMFTPLGMFLFFVSIIPQSFLLTHLYYKSKRIILAAILYHFSINFYGNVFDPTPAVRLFMLGILTSVTIFIIGKDYPFWTAKPAPTE